MYKIKDKQFANRYFADGVTFETKEAVHSQLFDYHAQTIPERYLRKHSLEDMLQEFGWELEEVS